MALEGATFQLARCTLLRFVGARDSCVPVSARLLSFSEDRPLRLGHQQASVMALPLRPIAEQP